MRVDAAILVAVAVVGGALWFVMRPKSEPPAEQAAGSSFLGVLPSLFDSATRLFNSVGSLAKGGSYERADNSGTLALVSESGSSWIGRVPSEMR